MKYGIAAAIISVIAVICAGIGIFFVVRSQENRDSDQEVVAAYEIGNNDAEAAMAGDETTINKTYFIGDYESAVTDADSALDAFLSENGALDHTDMEFDLYQQISYSNYEVYWFKPCYQGIPICGSDIKVIADEDGHLLMINGSLADIEHINLSYTIVRREISSLTEDFLIQIYDCSATDITIGTMEQVILANGEGSYAGSASFPTAAWRVLAEIGYTDIVEVYVDGSAGEVIAWGSLLSNAGMAKAALEGEEGSVILDVYWDDENYNLYDTERNLYVSWAANDGQGILTYGLNALSGTWRDEHIAQMAEDQMIITYNGSTIAKRGVSLLSNLQHVYDYFYETYGRKGPTGTTEALYAFVNYYNDLQSGGGTISTSNGEFPVIAVGRSTAADGATYCADEKVIAHEYMHVVVDYTSDLPKGPINEGLADIFAELSYLYNHEEIDVCSWENASRDIANADKDAELITSVDKYIQGTTNEHDGSTLISYPAYLMNTDEDNDRRIEADTLGQLYYITNLACDSSTDFQSFRKTLETVAVWMNYYGELTDAQLECVVDSVDYTGIAAELADYRIQPGGTLTILDRDGNLYSDCRIDIVKGLIGHVNSEVLESSIVTDGSYILPDTIVPGYYTVKLTDLKNTESTETFVLLVNDNSSNTNPLLGEYPEAVSISTEFEADSMAAYRNILMEYEQAYGFFQLRDLDWCRYIGGVNYLQLVTACWHGW